MNENAEQALEDFSGDVKVALGNAFKQELDKVDNLFGEQKREITTMLETMLARQTDMRELSVRLSQGVDNSIRTATEKLQGLQSKIENAMNVLRETQEEVTKTKEKLLNYKKEEVEISSKIKEQVLDVDEEEDLMTPISRIQQEYYDDLTEEDLLDEDEK